MFKLTLNKEILWPVTINLPIDGGKTETVSCEAKFKILPQDEFNKLANKGDAQILKVACIGWDGVADESDKPLEFTPENVTSLLQIPYVRQGFLQAYLDASSGIAVKN